MSSAQNIVAIPSLNPNDWNLIREIARNVKVDVRAIGGTTNHVHLLLAMPANRNLADVMRDIKANPSHILRQNNRDFRWQDGYCTISVSPGALTNVVRYIQNQEQHHRFRDFETEYLEMLERAGIEYAPEYVLD